MFLGDLVSTDAIGEAQLLFSDGTRMVVGANSSLVIDEFLFRSDATENKFAVRALAGTFRFISGEGGDKGYRIRTPSATIGVRGTAFDFVVVPGGTKLLLLEGEATLCNEDDSCATAVALCELLQTAEGEEVEKVEDENVREQLTREHFPYAESDSNLLAGFQFPGLSCVKDAEGGLADIALERSSIRPTPSAPSAVPPPPPWRASYYAIPTPAPQRTMAPTDLPTYVAKKRKGLFGAIFCCCRRMSVSVAEIAAPPCLETRGATEESKPILYRKLIYRYKYLIDKIFFITSDQRDKPRRISQHPPAVFLDAVAIGAHEAVKHWLPLEWAAKRSDVSKSLYFA